MSQGYIGKTCPYCQFPLKADSEVVVCRACKVPHHRECWSENGGCTTFGCREKSYQPVAGVDRLEISFDEPSGEVKEPEWAKYAVFIKRWEKVRARGKWRFFLVVIGFYYSLFYIFIPMLAILVGGASIERVIYLSVLLHKDDYFLPVISSVLAFFILLMNFIWEHNEKQYWKAKGHEKRILVNDDKSRH